MVEEVKTIELSTNPKKIVLLDKADTKERLIQLEKKYKRLNKISNGAIAVIAAGGTLGLQLFLEMVFIRAYKIAQQILQWVW